MGKCVMWLTYAFRDANVPYNLQYFDMKLLFLITALNPDVRTKVRDDYHGLTYLVEILDLIIKERGDASAQHFQLNDSQVNLLIEIMKVLFNITVRNETSVATEEEEEIQFRRLAVVLHDLLLCRASSKEKQIELCSNTINLLTNVPTACYSELVIPMHLDSDSATSFPPAANLNIAHLFEGHDVTALEILLEFLRCRLENVHVSLKWILRSNEMVLILYLNLEIICSARASVASADGIGEMCALQFAAATIPSTASVAAIA